MNYGEIDRRHALFWTICVGFFTICSSCGCSFQEQLYGPIIIFPDKDKINARIQCVLSREYKAHQLHLNVDNAALGVDRYDLDLEHSLSSNAEKMARSVFSEVTVTDLPGGRSDIDFIIIPKVNYISMLILDGNDASTSMELEWTVLNKDNEVVDKIIVQGEGHGKRVPRLNYFQANQEVMRIVAEDLIKDIFSRSLGKFYMNPEITKPANRKLHP
jgi:hypothetical protein